MSREQKEAPALRRGQLGVSCCLVWGWSSSLSLFPGCAALVCYILEGILSRENIQTTASW